ncbi:MAG: ribbon-helix-helix protein, CopG family [Deltaproteobacteria bacterium]|nr:ribbon-helix-helix protein, CopG family [Deltaproteobacteria bacterium]
MAVAKVALSLPEPLVNRIDQLAKKGGLSRSAFVRQAVESMPKSLKRTASCRKRSFPWQQRRYRAKPNGGAVRWTSQEEAKSISLISL